MAKNLNKVHQRVKTLEDKFSDIITDFAGSVQFVYVHLFWFGLWIVANLGAISFLKVQFDPFPFGLLTLIVSLEAIFLSTFVMISQNKQAKREEIRAELDYETDVKAEQEIAYLKTVLEAIAKEIGMQVKNGKVIKIKNR